MAYGVYNGGSPYGYGGVGPNGYGYGGYYDAYYAAAWQAFQNSQTINAQLVGEMQGIAANMMGMSNELKGEWEQTFIPELNKLIADANSYASTARIQLEMGRAESEVAQAFDAQRQNALADLQSYGIDPSSGRYAALDRIDRSQEAAAQAGAGNTAYQQTEAIARALRSEAIQASANLPGYANSAAGVAAGALRFPPNPAYPPVPPQRPLNPNARNGTQGISPTIGQGFKQPQVSVGKPPQEKPQKEEPQPPPQAKPNPSGGRQQQGPSSSLPQPTKVPQEGSQGQPPSSLSPTDPNNNAYSPGGAQDISTGESNQIYTPDQFNETPVDNQTNYPGMEPGGGLDPSTGDFQNYTPEDYNYIPPDNQTNYPGMEPGGSMDPSTGDFQNYTPEDYNYVPPDNQTAYDNYDPNAGGGLGQYGSEYADYNGPVGGGGIYDNTSDYGAGPDNSVYDNSDTSSSDWNSYQDVGYDAGGDFSKGGAIPYSASPSRGRRTDDIRGRVRQTKEPINVDAGEFIMPRHAVAYKGKQFFQKIIDDSKKFHAKHGKPKQRRPNGAIPTR